MKHHIHPIRIYYEDTDAGGIVYHASYIRFAERGRTEFLRHVGYNNSDLTRDLGTIFVIKHMDVEYFKPAYLDDVLNLRTSVASIKNTSFVMHQTFYRNHGSFSDAAQDELSGEKIADMKVALVCVDVNTIKPTRVPDPVRAQFTQFLEE